MSLIRARTRCCTERALYTLRGSSLAAAIALGSGCGGPEPPPVVAPSPPPASRPAEARWVPLDVAPSVDQAVARLSLRGVEVRLDRGRTRWTLEPGKPPRKAAELDRPAPVAIAAAPSGLFVLDDAEHAWLARDPSGALEGLGEAPHGLAPASLVVHRGGLTGRVGGALTFFPHMETAGRAFTDGKLVASIDGRRPDTAAIGADGAGIVLLSPQALATTTDGGATLQRIDDGGLFADTLAPDGERVVIAPGGQRDRFARAFTSGSSALARTPNAVAPTLAVVVDHAWLPDDNIALREALQAAMKSGAAVRPPLGWLVEKQHAAITGDGVVVVLFEEADAFGRAALGGALRPKKTPTGFCRNPRLSPCGSLVAAVCNGDVVVVDKADKVTRVDTKELKGQVLGVNADTPHSVVFTLGSSGVTTLARVDLDHPGAPRVLARGPELRFADVVHRCDAADAPFFVLDRDAVYRVAGGAAEATLEKVDKLAFKAQPLATTRDGGALLRDPEDVSTIVYVGPTGGLERRAVPVPAKARMARASYQPSPWSAVAFDDEDRGLAIDDRGRAFQSVDAGRTWQPTRGPGVPTTDSALVCSKKGCQLDEIGLRIGWDAAAPAVPPNATTSSSPLRIACKPDAAHPKVDDDKLLDVQIDFGVGDELWTGAVLRADRPGATEPDAQGGRELAIVGAGDDARWTNRSVRRFTWTATPQDPNGSLFELHRGRALGVAWVAGLTAMWSQERVQLAIATGAAPPLPVRGDFGKMQLPANELTPRSLVPGDVAVDDGVAVFEDHARKLIWVSDKGAIEARPFPGPPEHVDTPNGGSMDLPDPLHAALARSGDRWLMALLERRGMRLVALDPDGFVDAARLHLGDEDERGVGVMATPTGFAVVLVEATDGGGRELRLRSVEIGAGLAAASLALGSPRAIPGTRTAAGARVLSLPACGQTPPQHEMILVAGEAAVDGVSVREGSAGAIVGPLRRQVRYDASSACVLRTAVGHRFVARGNGDGPGVVLDQLSLTPVRCANVDAPAASGAARGATPR